ncbi:hypothetical protein IJI70_02605 [Candidatus Saccharibacteria bacterium]|nr:hypothetical protein [Candidatus Saccharibacteria bacterium]
MTKNFSKLKRLATIILCVFLSFSVVSSVALNTFADGEDDDSSFDDAFGEEDDGDSGGDSGSDDGSGGGTGTGGTITVDDDTPFPSEQCASGFGGMSWALCPGIETISEGTNGLYNMLADELNLNAATVVSTDKDTSATYILWDYFRGAANIFVIIFMVIVILSQITGYGINNYGIKRMLPKIIIAAILVNLSFYICQIAVDISNIIGSSVGSQLNGVAQTIATNIGVTYTGTNFIRIVVIIIVAAAGGAGVIFQGLSLGSGAGNITLALVIAAVVLVIIFLLAVLIFFAMLAIRQILAMACVAVSPLAIACMILPNTENLYKRWFKLLQSVLVIYPICSLLYGMACVIEVLALNPASTSLLQMVIASIACFLPFYAAPTLVIKALNGVGNIGARLQSLQQRGTNLARTQGRTTQGRFLRGETPLSQRMRQSSNNRVIGRLSGITNRSARQEERLARARKSNADIERLRQERRLMSSEDFSTASRNELAVEMDKKRRTMTEHATDAFRQAGRNENIVAEDRARREDARKATADFRTAGVNENEIAEDRARLDITHKATGDFVTAGLNRNAIDNRRISNETELFNNDDYVGQRMTNVDRARDNELIKMYQENYKVRDRADVITELNGISDSIAALYASGGPLTPAQVRSQHDLAIQAATAISDIDSKGGRDELIKYAIDHAETLRPEMIQVLSGVSPEFKEFQKWQAASADHLGRDFADFYRSNDGLEAQVNAHGVDGFAGYTKDNWKVLADQAATNPNLLSGANPRGLATAFATMTDDKGVNSQVQFIQRTMDEARRDKIIGEMSAEQVLRLDYKLKCSLAGVNVGDAGADTAIRTKFASQFNQIMNDPNMLSRASDADRTRFYTP